MAAVLLAVASLVAPAARSQPPPAWVPFDCTAPAGGPGRGGSSEAETDPVRLSDQEVIRSFEEQVRARSFGGPWRALLDDAARTTADALGLGRFLGPPDAIDPDHSMLLEAIRKHSLHYRVVRVVSWERTRCTGEPGRRTAFYLEAPLTGRQGLELHALLTGGGRLQTFGIGSPEAHGSMPPARLPTLEQAAEELAVEAGGPVAGAEYVLASGYPSCHASPCVAARRGDTLYLLEIRGRIFAFSLRPHTRDEVFPTSGRPCLGAPCCDDPWSLQAGDHWLAGQLLASPAS